MKKVKRPSASSHSKAEAAHLDNLLDEALRETFPASDPIAITIDHPAQRVVRASKVMRAPTVMQDSIVRGPLIAEAEQHLGRRP